MRLPLEKAVEKYEQNVFRAAYAVCSSRQDAEDVCQETFLAYYRSRKSFDSEEHLKAWLLRTAVNKAKNVCRAFWRRNRESLEDAYGWELRTAPPEERTLLEEVMKLPDRCRAVMHLFYYEDYSVREIAECLKCSEGTVKSQLHRGRTLLKGSLQEGWNDERTGNL
jgi:RNA polymerase sigma factor (sigma-70 family)